MTETFQSLMQRNNALQSKIAEVVQEFIDDTGFVPEITIEPVYQVFSFPPTKVLIRLEVKSKLTTIQ